MDWYSDYAYELVFGLCLWIGFRIWVLDWYSYMGIGWYSYMGIGWYSDMGIGWYSDMGMDWSGNVGNYKFGVSSREF